MITKKEFSERYVEAKKHFDDAHEIIEDLAEKVNELYDAIEDKNPDDPQLDTIGDILGNVNDINDSMVNIDFDLDILENI